MVRKFIRDFAIYGLGDLLVRASSFITLPIYTRLLSVSDYGAWSLLLTGVGLVSAVLILGGDSAYARLFFAAKSEHDKQVISSTWLIFLGAWSMGVVLLCLPFSEVIGLWALNAPGQGILVALTLLAAPIALINGMCAQVLRNQFESRRFVFWNIITTVLTIGFSLIGLELFHLGVAGVLGGTLVASLVMLPIRLWTARSMLRPLFSWTMLRDLLAYGVPLVPSSIAYWIFISSDRIVLNKLSTLEQIGLYAVASQFAGILGLVNNSLGQAWSPHAVLVYEEQREEAPVIFGRMMTAFLILFGILAVGITAFAHELTVIFVQPQYYGAAIAIGPLAIGFIAYASTQITGLSISLTKRTVYFSIYAWITAVVNLVLNLILVPAYGMLAASWSTAVAYIMLTLGYLVTSQRLWHIEYEKRRSLIAIALTFVFVIAAPALPAPPLILGIAFKLLYTGFFLILLIVLRVIDRDEMRELVSTFRRSRIRTAP